MAKILTTKIWDHARNPRNWGFLEGANVLAQAGDADDGDAVLYLLKIDGGRVRDASFLTRGCAAAIAASSMATELAIGKSLDDVLNLDERSIASALGEFPEQKKHCSELALSALHAAVRQYRSTQDIPAPTATPLTLHTKH